MRLLAIASLFLSLLSTFSYANGFCRRGQPCIGRGFTAGGGFVPSGGGFVSSGSFNSASLGVTNPNGEPAFLRQVVDQSGLTVFQVLDAFQNVVAETRSFIAGTNQPFFDQSTGLSSDGRRRISFVSATGSVGTVAPGSSGGTPGGVIQPATLEQSTLSNGQRAFVQRRAGEADGIIEVVTGNGRAIRRNGTSEEIAIVQPGDLVVRDVQNRLVLVDNNIREDLIARYNRLTAEQTRALGGRGIDLINLVQRRNQTLGSTGGSSPGGSHGTTGTSGTSGTTGREIAKIPPKSKFQTFQEKFDGITDGPSDVDGFIKKWGFSAIGTTQDAVVRLECVSPSSPNDVTKMAMILTREKVADKWVNKIRIEKDLAEVNQRNDEENGKYFRTDNETNSGQQAVLEKKDDLKLHRATREVKPYVVDYDLKIATVAGKKVNWVSVDTKVDGFSAKHYCKQQENGLLKKTPNADGTPPPAKVDDAAKDKIPAVALAVLGKKCATCHGPGMAKNKAFPMAADGTVTAAQFPDVFRRALSSSDDPMPPKDKPQLETAEKEALTNWAKSAGVTL